MRTDQYMGLPNSANELLEEAEKVFVGEFEGAFGSKFPLYNWILKDGRVLTEYVQTSPWNSGPMFFLALMDRKNKKPIATWTDEEIKSYGG